MIMQGIQDQNAAKYGSSGEYNIKSSSKYAACSCCPYGYHIDLDFVRYCESITQPNENIGINKRRERRRQRQSMEVMLGLVVSPLNMVTWPEQIQETSTENRKKQFCSSSASDMVKEALQDVVSDFENTLRASKKNQNEDLISGCTFRELSSHLQQNTKLSSRNVHPLIKSVVVKNNLKPKRIKIPDTNADSFNMSYFDAYNGNLSTATLHSIREQMALSLERMRDLENKIKIIPKLQIQLTTLKEEKNQLLKQLNKFEQQKADTLKSCGNNKHIISKSSSLPRQKHSHSMVDLLNCKTRDAAVTCRVLTRDIGVGHTVSKSRLNDESPRSCSKESKSIAVTTNMSMYDIDTLYEQIKTELSRKARLKLNEEIKHKRNFQNVSMETEITMHDIEKMHNEIQSGVRLSDMTINATENVAKISVGTQFNAKGNKVQKYDIGVQFGIRKMTSDFGIQISEIKPQLSNIAVNVKPEMYDKSLTVDTVEPCKTCKAIKRTIGVGTDFKIQTPVSLSSLMVPRSKSFNMGDDYMKKIKSISTQCNMSASNVTTQTVSQTLLNKSCQYECLQNAHTNKSCQCDFKKLSTVRSTDTNGLITCNDVGINCLRTKSFDVACSVNQPCKNCEIRKDEIAGNAQPSRIPRPSNITLTPPENRRFKRQQTYTKIPAAPGPDPTTMQLSALEGVTTSTSTSLPDSLSTTKAVYESSKSSLSVLKSNSSISQLHDLETQREISDPHHQTSSFQSHSPVRQEHSRTSQIQSTPSHCQPSIPQHQILLSDATSQDVTYTSQFIGQNTSVEENSLLSPNVDKQRQKVQPSKEMRAAMKVLNDYLQKSPNSNAVHQLKNATNIIQQEWFKVSSTATADPLDVEDYLDCFEETSSALLQYIVNMADMSGNTAMHYAVSHGNFDVVSILLDSKVCNINRSNKAGYTSVMLVSLAEMRSPTHANVVRKLFQLADVNIRAKQHGQTALMLAVSHGRLDMVMMLLEAGADINIQDEDGSTALMCAAEHGHIDIVKHFLAQHDCDSTITDVDGSTALKIALEAGHRDIGVLLYAHERMSHGSSPYSSLKYRRSKGSTPASTPPLNSPSRTHSDITN